MRKLDFFLCLPILLFAGTNQGSILLYNDSTYILSATIQAADGTYLGQFTIQPGQQSTFTQNLSPTGYTHAGAPVGFVDPLYSALAMSFGRLLFCL